MHSEGIRKCACDERENSIALGIKLNKGCENAEDEGFKTKNLLIRKFNP